MNMGPAQEYRRHPGHPGLARVLVPVLISHLLWTLRTAELAVLGKRECARRQSSADLVALLQVLIMWAAAFALSIVDMGSLDANARVSAQATAHAKQHRIYAELVESNVASTDRFATTVRSRSGERRRGCPHVGGQPVVVMAQGSATPLQDAIARAPSVT
jgi:hypothetical protein